MSSTATMLRPGIDFVAFATFLDQVQASWTQRRIAELKQYVAETGRPLPMPAETIVRFEDAGGVVDLETGWITWPSGIRTAVLPAEIVPVAATATEKA